jgi:hypothetical protein
MEVVIGTADVAGCTANAEPCGADIFCKRLKKKGRRGRKGLTRLDGVSSPNGAKERTDWFNSQLITKFSNQKKN